MKAICSWEIRGRPIGLRDDFLRQKIRKPLRCQRITVSGLTMTRARVQSGQSLRSATQNTRSPVRSWGRFDVRR